MRIKYNKVNIFNKIREKIRNKIKIKTDNKSNKKITNKIIRNSQINYSFSNNFKRSYKRYRKTINYPTQMSQLRSPPSNGKMLEDYNQLNKTFLTQYNYH